MNQYYDLSASRNKLIKKYLILIQIALFCFSIVNIIIVINITSIIILLTLILFSSLIIFFEFYKKQSMQYITIFILILIIYYFGINRSLAYLNLYYINIVLAIIFIFDLKKDSYKILSLFLFILIGAYLNIFTDFLNSGIEFSPLQQKQLFTLSLFLFVVFFTTEVLFIIENKSALESYITCKNDLDHLISKEKNKKEEKTEILLKIAKENNNQFFLAFQEEFSDLYQELLKFPELTSADLEMCAYLKLNLQTKEIATYKKISIGAVDNRKYRIRKKLNLLPETDLYKWINTISVNS